MTSTQQREDAKAPSAWRRMRLWALAHAIDDLYQGLVPSVVPYFVLLCGLLLREPGQSG